MRGTAIICFHDPSGAPKGSQKSDLLGFFRCLVSKVRQGGPKCPFWCFWMVPKVTPSVPRGAKSEPISKMESRSHPKSAQINKMGPIIRLASCLVSVTTILLKGVCPDRVSHICCVCISVCACWYSSLYAHVGAFFSSIVHFLTLSD